MIDRSHGKQTLYWHDYETFGTDPQRDRPVQFAGVRTDSDFNIVDDPLVVYCKPSLDYLPHPDACLITGILPQLAVKKGVCEAEFIQQIHQQLAQPHTCTLGYNNLRFDDEVTRNCLYRNFYDPYGREWQNSNSRWDLIDVVRAARALRPEGIEWPLDEQDRPSFRLELLTKANGIEHGAAHDALADVHATIAFARLLKQAQPKLYDFLWQHRGKTQAAELLQLGSFKPVLHVSGKYPAIKNCLAVVLPVCQHPTNSNGVIVYDLSVNPDAMLALTVSEIQQRVFTATADLPEGASRIPLKTVHLNKCPVLAPISVLKPADAERLEVDLGACLRHLEKIKTAHGLPEKIAAVFVSQFDSDANDPDLSIYSGGFFSANDKQTMAKIKSLPPEQLAKTHFAFDDQRLPEMLFRYRARNYPGTLVHAENQRWLEFCRNRLLANTAGAGIGFSSFYQRLDELLESNATLVAELRNYAGEIAAALSIDVNVLPMPSDDTVSPEPDEA